MIGVSEMLEMDRAPWYGVVVLVDIAIMALSPAVNDPNTAVQVIESMARLFPELARVRLAPFGRSDAEGRQRVAVFASSRGWICPHATERPSTLSLRGFKDWRRRCLTREDRQCRRRRRRTEYRRNR
jgi:hypothetical protein